MTVTEGTRIYYSGDMANQAGFGAVDKREVDEWGKHLHLTMDDGRDFWVDEYNFSPEYLGHGGTRFVTKAAYDRWRARYIAQMNTAARS